MPSNQAFTTIAWQVSKLISEKVLKHLVEAVEHCSMQMPPSSMFQSHQGQHLRAFSGFPPRIKIHAEWLTGLLNCPYFVKVG